MSLSSPAFATARGLWPAALGVLLALAGTAQAQTWDTLGEGLTVGHFVLHPSLSYEYTYDDNILFTSTDLPGSEPIASGTVAVRARILADLPIRGNRIRWVYAPFYRDYTSDRFRPEDRLNHVAYVEGTFHAGGATTIVFRDDFVNGTISLQEQVQRNGLPFGLGHYSTHNPRMEIGMSLGARRGFSLMPSYSRSAFTGLVSSLGQVVDYHYTTQGIEGRYNRKLNEPTTLYGYSAAEGTTQAATGAEDIAIRSRSIGLGLTRSIHQGLVTQLSAGYQTLSFEGGRGRNFSGPVAEASVAWQVGNLTRVNLGVLRKPYASIYASLQPGISIYSDSNYYIATEGKIRWTRQLGRSSYMDAGATFQDNQYVPLVGTGRRERLIRLEAGTGHQVLKHLRGYVGLNLEQRESNVLQFSGGVGADPFHYRLYRILFRLEAGWM